MNRELINNYLFYGYIPPSEIPPWLESCMNDYPVGFDYTVSDVSRLFDQVIDDSLSDMSQNGYCIVPISGGWDSRILMGAALDRFDTRQIKAFSFGEAGQLDFDLGRDIALKSGVEHEAVTLSDIVVTRDKLLKAIELSPWTSPFDPFFNQKSLEICTGEDDFVLSGFMGDPLTGGHLLKEGKVASNEFVWRQKFAQSCELSEPGYNPFNALPEAPDFHTLSEFDVFDFGIRQAHYVAPIVTLQKSWTGWGAHQGKMPVSGSDLITPFTHPSWAAYWIKAPISIKKNRILYLNMLGRKYPKLASMPGKDHLGAKAGSGIEYDLKKLKFRLENRLHHYFPRQFPGSQKLYNYIDYNSAFRVRDDYRERLSEAVVILENNDITPWLNLEKLITDHLTYKADHGNAFQLIIGLALNWAANKREVSG